ncbi:MAG TPA: response regulator [Flavobacterium sp.]|jgi:CheY-like chemotaxis protein
MSKSGTIVIVEDDADDKELLEITIRDLGYSNKIRWFRFAREAWDFMKATDESLFIIFCDVNLPKLSGLEFKKQIDDDPELRKKSIPFVFFSTSSNQHEVNTAYTEMTVQGYFVKGNSMDEIKRLVKLILEYWMACKHPNID